MVTFTGTLEIIGVIILLGPLASTSVFLEIFMIRTGVEEFLRKALEPAYRMEMDLKRYIEEVKEMINQRVQVYDV
jgi:BioD-like phosphotransacetylase family protein